MNEGLTIRLHTFTLLSRGGRKGIRSRIPDALWRMGAVNHAELEQRCSALDGLQAVASHFHRNRMREFASQQFDKQTRRRAAEALVYEHFEDKWRDAQIARVLATRRTDTAPSLLQVPHVSHVPLISEECIGRYCPERAVRWRLEQEARNERRRDALLRHLDAEASYDRLQQQRRRRVRAGSVTQRESHTAGALVALPTLPHAPVPPLKLKTIELQTDCEYTVPLNTACQ